MTSGLEVISERIQQIGEDSIDVISALLASSSMSVSMAVEICRELGKNRYPRAKTTPSIFTLVCTQKNLNINLLSVISALCEIYCGLTEDWEEFFNEQTDAASIPHAESIAFGFDFTDGCMAYIGAMRASQAIHTISDSVLERLELIILETKNRLDIVLKQIQNLDKESEVYKMVIEEIKGAPEIIILETSGTAGTSKNTEIKVRPGKRMKDITNPFVKAILQESGKKDDDLVEDDLSDLEDFIVANPETDYVEFIDNHFPLDNSQDSD